MKRSIPTVTTGSGTEPSSSRAAPAHDANPGSIVKFMHHKRLMMRAESNGNSRVRLKAWPSLRVRCSGETLLRLRSGQATPGRCGDGLDAGVEFHYQSRSLNRVIVRPASLTIPPMVIAFTGLCRGIVMKRVPSLITMCLPWRRTLKPAFSNALIAREWEYTVRGRRWMD
jgi:hypothetical protein